MSEETNKHVQFIRMLHLKITILSTTSLGAFLAIVTVTTSDKVSENLKVSLTSACMVVTILGISLILWYFRRLTRAIDELG